MVSGRGHGWLGAHLLEVVDDNEAVAGFVKGLKGLKHLRLVVRPILELCHIEAHEIVKVQSTILHDGSEHSAGDTVTGWRG